MKRRKFINLFPLISTSPFVVSPSSHLMAGSLAKVKDERTYWIEVITRIAQPVLVSLSEGNLKKLMPVEYKSGHSTNRREVTYLEAFGRLLAGIAPWLELGRDSTQEGKLRSKYIDLTIASLHHAVTPSSPDFMNFTEGGQPLVDAAFLAHGLIRSPNQVWANIDKDTKENLVRALQSTRVISPPYNNWLLFSAMVEAFLLKFGYAFDEMRIDYAIRKHLDWYKGDGVYGDGPDFHWDYYNSFVIQPMLLDIVKILKENNKRNDDQYDKILQRARRYAEVQERFISPEGTFPPIGRSLPYRFGAFQSLAQIALMKQLPDTIKPAQVRSGLTAVIRRMMEVKDVFDQQGWLKIGFYGHQPDIAENYISTGSLYLCTVGMLPLGLLANDPFWSAPAEDWTAKKIWGGQNLPADHALYEK